MAALRVETLSRVPGLGKNVDGHLFSVCPGLYHAQGQAEHASYQQVIQFRERRQVLSLAYLRGYTQEEIAAFTGLPLGTVKSHVRRSLSELREHLQAMGPEAQWN